MHICDKDFKLWPHPGPQCICVPGKRQRRFNLRCIFMSLECSACVDSVVLMGLQGETYVVQVRLRGPSVIACTLAALMATDTCILRSTLATHRCSVQTALCCHRPCEPARLLAAATRPLGCCQESNHRPENSTSAHDLCMMSKNRTPHGLPYGLSASRVVITGKAYFHLRIGGDPCYS